MKKILLTLTVLALGFLSSANAATLPAELSAVLVSQQYAKIIASKSKAVRASGQTLQIASYQIHDDGNQVWVNLTLAQRPLAELNGELTVIGEIVGMLKLDPMGNFVIEAVYFKPAADIPGGASVGT